MGTLSPPSAWTMLHLLLSSSLLALATAEADPQLLYGAGLPYAAGVPYVGASVGAVAHVPVVKSDVVTPAEVSQEVTSPTVPPVAYAHTLGYAGYAAHPLAYAGLPVLAPAAAAEEAVVAERRKREADPQVLAYGGLPYAVAP